MMGSDTFPVSDFFLFNMSRKRSRGGFSTGGDVVFLRLGDGLRGGDSAGDGGLKGGPAEGQVLRFWVEEPGTGVDWEFGEDLQGSGDWLRLEGGYGLV